MLFGHRSVCRLTREFWKCGGSRPQSEGSRLPASSVARAPSMLTSMSCSVAAGPSGSRWQTRDDAGIHAARTAREHMLCR